MRVRGLCHGGMLAAGLLLASCRSPDALATASPTDAACVGGANVLLAPLSARTLDCSAGTTITLPAGGAAYLVAAQLASGDGAATAVTYTISVPGSAVLSVEPAGPTPALPGSGPAPASVQAAFDVALRARGAQLALHAPAWPPSAVRSVDAGVLRPAEVPQVGSTRSFQVLSTTDFAHERFASVSARLAYAGTQVLLYVDEAAPAGGLAPDELTRFGRYFDEVLFPLDTAAFGGPTDIDNNGRLIMLLTPVVNALASRTSCGVGFIAGFFNPADLSGGTSSNKGEVFYGLVPDPAGSVSCPHTVAQAEALLPGTFLHEMQHLISYGQHVVVHRGQTDPGWLDEGLSLVAEELGAVYYQAKYPGTAGRTRADQLLPDSAEPFLANDVVAAQRFLVQPDTVTLTTHSDADPGAPWRGGDWLLLRWLGDQKGPGFYRTLEQVPASGLAAVEAAAGEPFAALFGDFALALYADSLEGVPRTALPSRLTVPSRNLRMLLAAFGKDYLLQPVPLTGSTTATLVPGASMLYRVSTSRGSSALVLRFSTPAGAPLPAALHPQLAVFRLPGA